ncbi:MAG: malonyl-ACP O-methyltransferase BioC [Gammaproteobacteria bacterium]|nr:malonyl-ACP O-methyltransferase BioC [Gammaproteobacteria bacterium]MCW8987875.1 malonyl-ACP O-methyltransferase BioC [Gammaproteobacteria bacterium]
MNNNEKNETLNIAEIDRQAMRAAFEKAASSYDAAAVLQQEVANRLVERMDLMSMKPQSILDAGAGTGFVSQLLAERYPKAKITALDLAFNMLKQSKNKRSFKQRWNKQFHYVNAEVENLPFADASLELVISGLTFQWCQDLPKVFKEIRRVLAPGGLLLFSTFGPDTLKELRQSWAAVDELPHVNMFADMHDVGDALLKSGFLDPVMDMEMLTVTYQDVKTVMHDLKQIGAHNVMQGRSHQITGKNKLKQMMQAYEQHRQDGLVPVSHEIVYGHAWLPEMKKNESSVVVPFKKI